jgi:hypothetical protein
MMSDTVLDRFFALEREKYGSAEYAFKGDKLSSKFRAFYARPFCPEYMESYSTSMYPNTYFAEKKRGDHDSCVKTEFHENVHKWDRWKQGFKFTLKYIWPHWVGVPFLAAAVVLGGLWSWLAFGALLVLLHTGLGVLAVSAAKAESKTPSKGAAIAFYVLTGVGALGLLTATILGGGYFALLWVPAALFFSPWPLKPWWRRDAELRGYTMSLYRIWLQHKNHLNDKWWADTVERYVKTFSGSAYFFMETNGNWTRKELGFQINRFRDNEATFLENWQWSTRDLGPVDAAKAEAEPFRMASKFMKQEGLIDG